MLFFKKRVLFGLLSSSFFLSVSVGDDPFRKRKKRQHVGDDEAQGKCGDENQKCLNQSTSALVEIRKTPDQASHQENMHEEHSKTAVAQDGHIVQEAVGNLDVGESFLNEEIPCRCHQDNQDAQIPKQIVEVDGQGKEIAAACHDQWQDQA